MVEMVTNSFIQRIGFQERDVGLQECDVDLGSLDAFVNKDRGVSPCGHPEDRGLNPCEFEPNWDGK